ncbi:MAG: YicC/YloC family endoribonuclease [Hyphomicrobiales bacterium]
MTGFASREGSRGSARWRWEIRTVNGRGLDIRLRLPPGLEGLEPQVREMCKARLSRGNVSISLNISREGENGEIRLNEAALRQVIAAMERARQIADTPPAGLDSLLSVRGVLESGEPIQEPEEAEVLNAAMLASLDDALGDLARMREGEGARLEAAIRSQLKEIGGLVESIARSPARKPEAIAMRLREQLKRIGEDKTLDPDRLHQEAVLLATRADVEEEIERLKAHVEAALELAESGEPAGRKFEFLTQEFNREANTICSKSNDIEMTRSGLALKSVIDQMREQVQNIE